ncbi:hypothetical protein BZA70DRAFT_267583 [Myxozyma melibiosi]|uniref:Uncharacterized protein n=1 Tax=Myxozyma melibiosi TaxID=54550 RepID=A0ABR1F5B4_9ASCO
MSTDHPRRSKPPKPPTFSKNGVRMGRPPGTKNKPKPNGPKVGRPSLNTIFMVSDSVFPASDGIDPDAIPRDRDDTNTINLAITDVSRAELGLLPFDPSLRFKHGYLAKRQKCRYAVIPVYSREERLLFAKLLKTMPPGGVVDWPATAKLWNSYADGKAVFYKLPQHLEAYSRLLRECAMSYSLHSDSERASLLASLPEGASEFAKKLIAADPAAMTLAVAVTAGHVAGSSAPKDSLISAREAATIPAIENMLDSLDIDVMRLLDGGHSDIDPLTGVKRRGRRPSVKSGAGKARSVEPSAPVHRLSSTDPATGLRTTFEPAPPAAIERSSDGTMAVRRASSDSHHDLSASAQLYLQSQSVLPFEPSSYYAPMVRPADSFSYVQNASPQPGGLPSSLRTSLDKTRPSYPLSPANVGFGSSQIPPQHSSAGPSQTSQQAKGAERRYPIYYY